MYRNNSNYEKQVFLMNPNGKRWHYIAVKNISIIKSLNNKVIFIV